MYLSSLLGMEKKKRERKTGRFDPIDMGRNFFPPLVNIESLSLMPLGEYLFMNPEPRGLHGM